MRSSCDLCIPLFMYSLHKEEYQVSKSASILLSSCSGLISYSAVVFRHRRSQTCQCRRIDWARTFDVHEVQDGSHLWLPASYPLQYFTGTIPDLYGNATPTRITRSLESATGSTMAELEGRPGERDWEEGAALLCSNSWVRCNNYSDTESSGDCRK